VTLDHPLDYREVLARIHTGLRPRTYLEIGVAHGESLALAQPPTLAIGVDPSPRIRVPILESTRLVAQRSDEFFARPDLTGILGDLPVDVAFIDGLHLFEQVLRDFVNVERRCHRDSVILVHDCDPPDAATASRVQGRSDWAGDVWKLVVWLVEARPDLAVTVVQAPPTGLAVITRLDPDHRLPAGALDEAVLDLGGLEFEDFVARRPGLPTVDSDWEHVRRLLPAEPFEEGPPSTGGARRVIPGDPWMVRHRLRRGIGATPLARPLRAFRDTVTGR
jgi:hypothetical protein